MSIKHYLKYFIVFVFLIIAISTAKKASEERLQRLQKSVDLYKDRLGLEIRKIYGKYIINKTGN